MKLKTLLLTTALVTSSAFADAPAPMEKKHVHSHEKMEGYYAEIEAGAGFPTKIKTGLGKLKSKSPIFVGGLGLGYQVNEFFRGDLMLHYRQFKSKSTTLASIGGLPVTSSAKANATTLMLNGYVDGHNDTIFTPYLVAGIGTGYISSKVNVKLGALANATGTVKKFDFVWNAGLGVLAKATDQLSFDLGYRYVSFPKVGDTKAVSAVVGKVKIKSLASHEASIGAIWHF